ncbi:N-acetylmuramoyl-L-alanine amidase LytC precursor [Peptococcaceae bacterium CEB3]|nr:N-acetylmuramoyl-L-alanine amidase LytC precursor [Peptococcaceae bacterium CEB3]
MRRLALIPGRTRNLAMAVVLAVMISLVFSVVRQGSAAVSSQMSGAHTVVIDPGHGGYDPGAVSKLGIYEKEINLEIAARVAEQLKPSGMKAILTRDEDEDYVAEGVRGRTSKKQTDLNYRINLANSAKADVLVSIHVNATKGGLKSGAETFYNPDSVESTRLAEAIQRELIKVPGMNRRIAKPGDFYLLKNCGMPAVIVEVGYLNNPAELKKLQQPWYLEYLAHAIAKGIGGYFGLP